MSSFTLLFEDWSIEAGSLVLWTMTALHVAHVVVITAKQEIRSWAMTERKYDYYLARGKAIGQTQGRQHQQNYS
jgi:hypothetical protein